MQFARSSIFWLAALALAGIWLAMLLLGGPQAELDREWRSFFLDAGDPQLIWALSMITWLGGWQVLTFVTVPAAVYLIFRRRRRAALLLVMVFFGRLFVELQKWLLNRPRPGYTGETLSPFETMSFPSGHAANSMITYLAIALLLPVGRGWRGSAIVLALILTFVIGVTRAVLGYHWPTDVVGGWAFGLLWILFCVRISSPPADPEPG